MGKHSAPRVAAATAAPVRPAPAAAPQPASAPSSHERAAVPAVLAQTAAFGALAIVVAVMALTWAGIGGREAALVGIGLLLVGVVGFFLIRRTGLIRDAAPRPDERAGQNGHI